MFSSFSYSQEVLWGSTLSYSNQSGNFGKAGLFFLFGLGDNMVDFKLDSNANMGYMRDNFHVIPEVGITGYVAASQLMYIFSICRK